MFWLANLRKDGDGCEKVSVFIIKHVKNRFPAKVFADKRVPVGIFSRVLNVIRFFYC